MCDCPKVHFYEVDFKLVGMKVVPSHKNCCNPLSNEQFSTFEKELVKHWGIEQDWSGAQLTFKSILKYGK